MWVIFVLIAAARQRHQPQLMEERQRPHCVLLVAAGWWFDCSWWWVIAQQSPQRSWLRCIDVAQKYVKDDGFLLVKIRRDFACHPRKKINCTYGSKV
jgi:hypothetical protein